MKEERNKIFLQWLLPAAVMLVVIVVMLINFSVKSQESMISSYENELITMTKKYANRVNYELTSITKVGFPLTDMIGGKEYKDKSALQHMMASLERYTDVYLVMHCDENGTGLTHTGNTVDMKESEEYEMVAGTTAQSYYYVKADGISGREAIISSIPIEGTPGHLLLYYPTSHFQILLKDFELEHNAFMAVVDREGRILLKSNEKSVYLEGDNLFDAFKGTTGANLNDSDIKRIQNGLTGSLKTVVGNDARTLIYTPLEINNWTVFMGVNNAYMERQHQKLFKDTQNMLLQLIAVICIFLGVLVVINIISKVRGSEKTKQLQQKADTDLLTGLNNKLASERKIKEYIASHGDEIAMMFVLDIDNFKTINDTMGHAFGDEVLRSLGDQISVYFRSSDVIGRTGGDEFTVFLKNLKDDVLIQKEANKILTFFRGFEAGEYVKYAATASIGAAVFPRDGKDFETLYKAADQALYKAKKRGKNQLAFYAESDDEMFAAKYDKRKQK